MASPIVPKSEIRQIRNISFGFGEVPAVEFEGIRGWALPGNLFTLCEKTAREAAKKLDATIKKSMASSGNMLSA